MKANEFITEAANPAQQAAIAVNMKKHHQKPKGVAEGDYADGSSIKTPGSEDWKQQYQQAVMAVKNARTQQEYEAASDRAGRIKDLLASKGIQVGAVLGQQGVAEGENWSKHNNKRVGGMSKKSVSSYRRSHPGSKIQTAVTKKPSKIKKGSKDAKRRASFCARMRGMKKHRTSAKTARDPNSNINKSLRRWNCESIEQMEELLMLAEQMVAKARKEIL